MPFGDGEVKLWRKLLIPNIINAVIIAFALLVIWVYYNRRYRFPIKGRGSHPVLLVAWIYTIILLSLALRGPYWPCVVDSMIYITGSQCAAFIYVYRVAVLLARHDLASKISLPSTNNLLNQQQNSKSRCGKRCNVLDTRKWNMVLLVYGFLVACIVLAIAAGLGDDWNCYLGSVALASNGMLIVILLPVLTVLGCKLRKYPADGRKISTEFRCVAISISLALVIYTAVSQTTNVYYGSIYFLDVVGLAVYFTSMCFPIYLTYQHQRRVQVEASTARSCSLEGLLENEDFCVAFLAHLKTEFNAESFVFWQSVTLFKAKGQREPDQMIPEITTLMETYLGRNAPFQLNVSDESVSRTEDIVEQAKASGEGLLQVFDALVIEVVHMMKNDPFPRFLRTPVCREIIAAVTAEGNTPRVKDILMSALIPNHSESSIV